MLVHSATLSLLPREPDATPASGTPAVVRGRVLQAVPWKALAFVALALLPHSAVSQSSFLFVWAGGKGASEFMATIDADPASATYGRVLASVPTGTEGMPHHTEHELPLSGHLLANDFHAGRTWLFDLHEPLRPRILGSFGDVAGYSHPHTFIRLANGRVLSTFQYRAVPVAGVSADVPMEPHRSAPHGGMSGMAAMPPHLTGGLVEMDERGRPFLSASAVDTNIADRFIYPYSVLPIPAVDRAVSTTTDMNEADTVATSEWVQFWRLSDLKLLTSIALPPGPRGDENRFSGEARLLPDGRSVYIHTFNCGLYLVRHVDSSRPTATFVHGFAGKDCGVPILTGHYWLQTVPAAHGLIALDITDPEHPREISRVSVGADEQPHWIALDPTGRRIVMNSGGHGNRLFIINFDPANGRLSLDQRFHDPGSTSAGILLTGANWPRGFIGNVMPHGAVFSR